MQPEDELGWIGVAVLFRYATYLLWAGLLAGLGWLILAMLTADQVMVGPLLALGVCAWAVVRAALAMFIPSAIRELAINVTADKAPLLFSLIREACTRTGATMPDHVLLTVTSSFHVYDGEAQLPTDKTVRGRILVLSAPLLRLLSRDEAGAILAHEFAHYTGRDTEYSVQVLPVYRSCLMGLRTLGAELTAEVRSIYGLVYRIVYIPPLLMIGLFFYLFQLIDRQVSRSRELRADAIACRAFSAEALAGGIAKVVGFGTLLEQMASQVFIQLGQEGATCTNFPLTFSELAPTLTAEAGTVLLAGLSQKTDLHDTHPALSSRLQALGVDAEVAKKKLVHRNPASLGLLHAEVALTNQITLLLTGNVPNEVELSVPESVVEAPVEEAATVAAPVERPTTDMPPSPDASDTSTAPVRPVPRWIYVGACALVALGVTWVAIKHQDNGHLPRPETQQDIWNAQTLAQLETVYGKFPAFLGKLDSIRYDVMPQEQGPVVAGVVGTQVQYEAWVEAQRLRSRELEQWLREIHQWINRQTSPGDKPVPLVIAYLVRAPYRPSGFDETEVRKHDDGSWSGLRLLVVIEGPPLASRVTLTSLPISQGEAQPTPTATVLPRTVSQAGTSGNTITPKAADASTVKHTSDGPPVKTAVSGLGTPSNQVGSAQGGTVGGSASASSSAPPGQPGQGASSSGPLSSQPTTTTFLTWGATRDRVQAILGTPTRSDNTFWYYGEDYVQFDFTGKVNGWKNASGNLRVSLGPPQPTAPPIHIGSTGIEVAAAMGTPSKADSVFWYYGEDYVQFDFTGKVNGWKNASGNLRVSLGPLQPNAPPIRIGSTGIEVAAAMGTPWKADSVFWYYGEDYVQFDFTGNANGWKNASGNLRVSLGPPEPGATPIRFGSTGAKVAAAMGTPWKADSVFWYYGEDYVQFDFTGKVNGWANASGNLRVSLGPPQPTAPPIRIGSTGIEVAAAMGTPRKADSVFWYYGQDYVQFDFTGKVNGWTNVTGNLKVQK